MKNRTAILLAVIVLLTVTLHLIFAFITPTFSYESYFHFKQVESITETGTPLFNDPLSYGGRTTRFLPFFHYFMAIFALVVPLLLLAKIIPSLLLGTIPLLTYCISKRLTFNTKASLVSAAVSAFLPILFITNNFTVDIFFLPLFFLALYSLLRIKEKPYLILYIVTFILLCFTSAATILLLLGFMVYLLLSVIERKKIKRSEIELILFSIFFYLWAQLIFFKNALLQEGISFIWQNTPTAAILSYLPQPTIAEALIAVSIIPLLTGVYLVYNSLFRRPDQKTFLLISLVISTALLFALGLVPLNLALSVIGILLAILFAFFFREWQQFWTKTKIAKFEKLATTLFLVILFTTMLIPLYSTATAKVGPSEKEIRAYEWLGENAPLTTTVIAPLEEGHLVNFISHHKNVIDDQFLFVDDVDERFSAVKTLYVTPFYTNALKLLDTYYAQYIVVTTNAQERFSITALPYADTPCIQPAYSNEETTIYVVNCALEQT